MAIQMKDFFSKLNSLYSGIKNSVRSTNIIMEAKKHLKQIPQMDYVFAKLPRVLAYNTELGSDGAFRSNGWFNRIVISPTLTTDDYYEFAGTKMILIATLSHELCHANQQECGLTEQYLKDASFSDVFRVYKMTELEAALLEAIVENELVKQPEFEGFGVTTERAFLYDYYLDKENGDIQKAKRDFVLSCWTNSCDNIQTPDIRLEMICQNAVRNWHREYTKDATEYVFSQKYALKPTITPIQAIDACLQRMGLNGVIRSEFFLQNGSDNTKINNRKRTVTLLNQNGEKHCKYYMKSDEIKVTMFENKKARTL